MLELFVTVLAALFSVVDPPGAIPLFLAMTPDYTKRERNQTARNTAFWFIALMLAFFLAGTYILSFFGITLNAVRIAGGLIILSSGYALLEGKFGESRAINDKVKDEAIEKEDISFAPLAMPMLSGPGSISLLIGMYAENPDWSARGVIITAVLILGLSIYLILRASPMLYRIMGVAGLKALSRIMGFLVMAIGIQFIIQGIVSLVGELAG